MQLNNDIEIIIDSGHFQVDSIRTEMLRVDAFDPGIQVGI